MRPASLYTSLLAPALVLLTSSHAAAGAKTHVGVKSNEIVMLVSELLPNDNSGSHVFKYDQSGPTFSVPEGRSFVVTDVWVTPNSISFAATDQYWVYINVSNNGSRYFDARFTGPAFYQSLSTGLVMPGGTTPTARNLTDSTWDVVVKMQGYFVKGAGLPANTALFPPAP